MDAAHRLVGKFHNVTIHDIFTNDAWIRDHGPTFICPSSPAEPDVAAILDWQYNAWGNKYPPFDYDNDVPRRISEITSRKRFEIDFVLEGGAIEGNGAGIVMTTESCVLNSTRNRSTTRDTIRNLFHDHLGTDHVLWLGGNIPGDDTDGHIDQLARFVNASTVVVSTSNELPKLRENINTVEQSGLGLNCIDLPMPSPKYLDSMRLPASYANFYIVNGAVIVPEFEDANDQVAQQILSGCFPDRQLIGLPALSLVVGLGAFHCLSQQEPVALSPPA
jgi:agmatine deiminase